VGGSMSVVDILSSVYSKKTDSCEVILSKGHCILALLSVLKNIGEISHEQLDSYYAASSQFGGHPKKGSTASVTWSTGSLGHGLSVACGKAMARPDKKFICILGDGETNEGSIWEAFLFMRQHRLCNLLAIIDNNRQESLDKTDNILGIDAPVAALASSDIRIARIDGHDHMAILKELDIFFNITENSDSFPTVILAETVKGKGISFMEHDTKWHHRKIADSEYDQALTELGAS